MNTSEKLHKNALCKIVKTILKDYQFIELSYCIKKIDFILLKLQILSKIQNFSSIFN